MEKMNSRIKQITGFTLFGIFILLIQPESTIAQEEFIRFEHLDFENSIPQNYIYSILQDHYGYMWFGTLSGLVRYDGNQYKVYTYDPGNVHSISTNEIISIFEDSKGSIWVGTIEGGLNQFNRNNEEFTKYFHVDSDSTTLSNNSVWCIQEDVMGNIWVGTSNGLNRLRFNEKNKRDTVEISRYFYSKNSFFEKEYAFIRSILVDHMGRLWISIFGKGLYLYDQKNDQFFQVSSRKDNIVSIFEDSFYTLWLATWGQGLIKVIVRHHTDITAESVQFVEFRKKSGGLISNYVWSLEEDRFKNLWIGTYAGLNKYDRKKNEFSLYQNAEYDERTLSSNQISSLCEDKSGVLWIGAFQGGIDKYIYHTNRFKHFRHDPLNHNSLSSDNIGSLFKDRKGYLWIGTLGGGLNRYDQRNAEFLHYTVDSPDPDNLNANIITSISEDTTGALWIGTYKGLYRLGDDGLKKQIIENSESQKQEKNLLIQTLVVDHCGDTWIGTGGKGLYRLKNIDSSETCLQLYRHDPSDNNSLCHDNVMILYEGSDSVLWIGTYNGLNKVKIDSDNLHNEVLKFTHYQFDINDPQTISNNKIYSIFEDKDGYLWIGTSFGLNKFDRKNNRFIRYNEKDGLPNNVINGILADTTGHLWLSTNTGLSKFNPDNEVFHNFNNQDDLHSSTFGPNLNAVLSSGELAFGGINGIIVFDPYNITSNKYVPPVVITDFKTYGRSIIKDKNINDLQAVTLSYEEKYFTIDFSALDYTSPEKNQYLYKLEGFDDEWVHALNNNSAVYTNIDPGSYTFKVIGSNSAGVWNTEGASIKLNITPPFWQMAWFKILLFLLISTVLFLIIYGIKMRAKKNSEIKEKMTELRIQALRVKMNPHFIFNTINSIQYFLTANEKEMALSYLAKFARLMRLTLEFSDKTIISIAEELESLRLYLDLEKLRFENKFDYNIEVDPAISTPTVMIPNLLIQPYVENAVKHGIQNNTDKGMIKVKLKKVKNEISYTIEDNGIGIKKSLERNRVADHQKKSHGMMITYDRIKLLNHDRIENGDLEVTDLSDSDTEKTGTKVTIRIPIMNRSIASP
jgi:ligand-binding sensor domain-containing protein/sensor histidine kinase YesM